jgi:hypothetical protein
MDPMSQFKVDGDLSLTVPLSQGFEKVLYDFVQMTARKSGFEGDDPSRIAGQISDLIQEKMKKAEQTGQKAHVAVLVEHGRGYVTIRTTIHELSFSKEEKFQA